MSKQKPHTYIQNPRINKGMIITDKDAADLRSVINQLKKINKIINVDSFLIMLLRLKESYWNVIKIS